MTGTRPRATSMQIFDDALVLVVAERRAFAGRAHRHEAVAALLDLPVDEGAEGLLVEPAVAHRRHQRGESNP